MASPGALDTHVVPGRAREASPGSILTPGPSARSPCDPASGTRKAWATVQAAEARGAEHDPQATSHAHPWGPRGWRHWGGWQPWCRPVLPMDPRRSKRTSVPSRWRSGGGDPRHLSPTAPRRGGTHPGAEQVAARLLDAADKVPSFCLEQKFTPEESEFRSPRGGGLGLWGPPSWLPSLSAKKALGRVPALPLLATVHRALAELAVWEAASAEHQGRTCKRAVSRGPHPRDATSQTVESGGPYLGNHLACSVQGSSPCSQLCRPP